MEVLYMEVKFTANNFEAEVMQSQVPVLVDFYADWCGPCRAMGPVVDKLAKQYDGKVKVGKLNVDDEMELAQKYRVANIPTFLIFKNGQEVERMMGITSEQDLSQKLDQVLQ